jgi:diguanylate cyclase (GGDEF)-like protein
MEATSGREALKIAQTEKVDLILLDVIMPDMDGYETCRQLKDNPVTQSIPIIFVTAMGEMDDETIGLNLGAIDYLVKPIRTPILKARVKNHLELKKYRDSLESLCMVDSLTGIPNRSQFERLIDKEWRRFQRTGESLSLFFIDIDSFKGYNDRYGHLAGDDCLRQVAAALDQTAKRGGDVVVRYGGDEFCAIAPGVGPEGAELLGELFRSGVQKATPVTVCVGVSTMQSLQGSTLAELMRNADQALYQAKRSGKNKVVVYAAEDQMSLIQKKSAV